MIAATACTQLQKETPPTPTDTTTQLSKLSYRSDSSGQAVLPVVVLGIDRTQAFTLSSSGFKHGRIRLIADTGLAYQAAMPTGWLSDSGTVRLCQQGRCRERTLVVQNSIRPGPQPLACTDLPSITRQITAAGITLTTNLPGMNEAGARLDSIWGYIATADMNGDSTGFTYAPSGVRPFPNVAAADVVYYQVRRAAGQGCYRSAVRFFYPDSCTNALAHQDAMTLPALPSAIAPAFLLINDVNCTGAPAIDAALRLAIQAYTPASRRLKTPNGTITDTLISGSQQFYYRRTNPAARTDTFTYYLNEQTDLRISKAQVILTLP